MKDSPVTTNSAFLYQFLIFIVLQIWAIMIFNVAMYQMVTLYETPLEWFGWCSLAFLTLMPVLSFLSWKLKNRVQYHEVEWEYRVQEVSAEEFFHMVKSYNAGYSHILSLIDLRLLPLVVACYLGALFLPFPLTRAIPTVILLTPVVIAAFLTLFGVFFAYFVFRFVSNPASREFPHYRPRMLIKSVEMLSRLPAVFWAGVRLTIGEAGGFYTLKQPRPIARIEGIEGIARLECVLNENGKLIEVVAVFGSETSDDKTVIAKEQAPVTELALVRLIRRVLDEYIKTRDGEDLLEEVLEEIKSYISKHDELAAKGSSSDGLISSNEQGPNTEERT